MARNVLVVSTVEGAEDAIRDQLGDDVDEVKVVVPAVRQGVLDWLANDERAFAHARDVGEKTGDARPGETGEATPGEADVDLAIRDALATFPADEVVVAVRPEEESGAVESAATREIPRELDGVPVRRLVVRD